MMLYRTMQNEGCKDPSSSDNGTLEHQPTIPSDQKKTPIIKSMGNLPLLPDNMDQQIKMEFYRVPFDNKQEVNKLKSTLKRTILIDAPPSPILTVQSAKKKKCENKAVKVKRAKGTPLKKKNTVKSVQNKTSTVLNSTMKKIQMHVTNMKDQKLANKLAEKNIGAGDLYEQIKTYICKFCCKRFSHPQNLKVHLAASHQDNPVHKCHLCGLVVSTFSALMSHYVKHSGIKMFGTSEVPPKKNSSAIGKTDAKACEKNKMEIFCTKCKMSFNTQKMFVSHFCPAVNKKTEYVCTYCRKVTTTVEEYRDHIQSHSTAHFLCGHCSVRFESKASLKEHFLVCKKRPKASKAASTKKVMPSSQKKSPLSGLKFKKLKPQVPPATEVPIAQKSDILPNDQSNTKDGEPRQKSLVIKEEPLEEIPFTSEKNDWETSLDIVNGNNSRQFRSQRMRTRRARAAPIDSMLDSSSTRRSARLVNRKPFKFSQMSSDSEYEEGIDFEEKSARSTKRLRSPVKSEEMPVLSEAITPPLSPPKKIKVPSPKSPKKQKKTEKVSTKSLEKLNEMPELHVQAESSRYCEPEQNVVQTLSDEVMLIQETIAKECQEALSNMRSDSPKKEPPVPINTDKPQKVPKNSLKNLKSKVKKWVNKKTSTKKQAKIVKTIVNTEISKQATLICNLCSLAFRCKGSLKRHRRMHSGKPQFACQYCGKFFFRKDIHKRHEMNVHCSEEDKRLVCYYCKEAFTDSSELKEHAHKMHSSKALAPERIRRCTGNNNIFTPKKIKTEVLDVSEDLVIENEPQIKQEPDEHDAKKSSMYSYTCKTCFLTYQNSSELIKHCNKAHSTISDSNNVKMEETAEVSVSTSPTKKEKISKPSTPIKTSPKKIGLLQKNHLINSTVTINKPVKNRKKSTTAQDTINSAASIEEPNIPIDLEQSTNDKCDLHCAIAAGTESSLCERDNLHKAVEWYQCQICPVSGPVSKMKDHMFKHMTKIGVFIVNCDNTDFDHLSTKSPFECQDNTIDSLECPSIEESLPQVNGVSSVIQPNGELCASYGVPINPVRTLMSEIKCTKCSTEIIDSDILENHPCSEQDDDGVYSCFVEDCEYYTTVGKEDMQRHLRESHFNPLYEELGEESNINSDSESESCTLRLPEDEELNFFIFQ